MHSYIFVINIIRKPIIRTMRISKEMTTMTKGARRQAVDTDKDTDSFHTEMLMEVEATVICLCHPSTITGVTGRTTVT